MHKFKSLFLMQLKEKMDLSFLKDKKQTLFKIVFYLLGFALITAASFLVFYLCELFNIFSALKIIPISFMTLILFIILILNTISCTIGLSKSLYYSKDNQVLVTYPVSPNLLFLSKLLVYYISEIKKAFTLQIPIFLAFGIISKYSGFNILYYLWMPLFMILLSSIPVLIGGLLSIPTNYIMRFLNKYPIIKVISIAALLSLIVIFVILLISKIPPDINLIKRWAQISKWISDFLKGVTTFLYPFYMLTLAITGSFKNMTMSLFTNYMWIGILILLTSIIILSLLNYLTSRPLYLKMITKHFEFDKTKLEKEKKNKKIDKKKSPFIYESLRCIKNPNRLTVSVGTLIISVILVLLLNKLYNAIGTRLSGTYLEIAFNILVILLITLCSNINCSSIFSKDGQALLLNKINPISYKEFILPRLLYNCVSSIVILIPTCLIFFTHSSIKVSDSILCFIMILLLTFTHIIWSADSDFTSPQTLVFQTNGSSAVSKNEIKSTILVFLISFSFFLLTIFFLNDSFGYKFLKLMLFALILFLVRLYLFLRKSRALYKEL